MTDYKLVPVEPTAEMEQAGGAVYWKNIEDVCEIYRAMVAAAPAVQGEPAMTAPTSGIVEAMRQYMHNDGSGVVFGYDKEAIDRYIEKAVSRIAALERAAIAAPDVEALVEALQAISRNELDAQRAQHVAAIALAAHSKQGAQP